MKIGVTGGAGFIGTNLVRELLKFDHEVVVVDDLSTGLISNTRLTGCKFFNIDITDYKSLLPIIFDCEVVFHLAARGSVPRSIINPIRTHEVNTVGTLNILEIIRKSKAHLIYSSSSSVYGDNTVLPKTEKMWMSPKSPYAASKLSAESFIQAYTTSYELKTTILRLFNVFGPFQRPDHEYAAVIPKWIWSAIMGRPIQIYGDGTATRDFTHVDSVVEVAIKCMQQNKFSNGAINLAFGNSISLEMIIEMITKFFPNLTIEYLPKQIGDISASQNLPQRLYEIFPDLNPDPFSISLEKTLKWYIANKKELLKSFTLIK